uniref:EGF-like domain-containing protein n=1 Tax=Rhabditophanes sp. KR3021 TaxID=114890 RepID=A0AC35TSL0_9BILA
MPRHGYIPLIYFLLIIGINCNFPITTNHIPTTTTETLNFGKSCSSSNDCPGKGEYCTSFKICLCLETFVDIDNKCHPKVFPGSGPCYHDAQCSNSFPGSFCSATIPPLIQSDNSSPNNYKSIARASLFDKLSTYISKKRKQLFDEDTLIANTIPDIAPGEFCNTDSACSGYPLSYCEDTCKCREGTFNAGTTCITSNPVPLSIKGNCATNEVYSEEGGLCLSKQSPGQPCQYSEQCSITISGAFCLNRKCACPLGWVASADGKTCNFKDTQCQAKGFIWVEELGECKEVILPGSGTCSHSLQCSAAFGGAVCFQKVCKCPTLTPVPADGTCGITCTTGGESFSSIVGSCLPNVEPGNECVYTSQCHAPHPGTICSMGRCKCARSQVFTGTMCADVCPSGFRIGNFNVCQASCNANQIEHNGNCLDFAAPGQNCEVNAQCTSSSLCATWNDAGISGSRCTCPSNMKIDSGICVIIKAQPGASCLLGEMCTGGSYCTSGICACNTGTVQVNSQCITPISVLLTNKKVLPNDPCPTGLENCLGGSICQAAICTCQAGSVAEAGQCRVISQVQAGQACSSSRICMGQAVCVRNICTCIAPYYQKNGDCIVAGKTLAGLSCANGESCPVNAFCHATTKICNCIPPTTNTNGICTIGTQASPGDGCRGNVICGGLSNCINDVCTCATGTVNFNGVCTQIVSNLGSCTSSDQCPSNSYCDVSSRVCVCPSNLIAVVGPGSSCLSNAVRCGNGSQCTSGTCQCNGESHLVNGRCVKQSFALPGESCAMGQECSRQSVCSHQTQRCECILATKIAIGRTCVDRLRSHPGFPCGGGEVCVGGSQCHKSTCKCPGNQIAIDKQCTEAKRLLPGSNCKEEDICTGGSECSNQGKCECRQNQVIVQSMCTRIILSKPTEKCDGPQYRCIQNSYCQDGETCVCLAGMKLYHGQCKAVSRKSPGLGCSEFDECTNHSYCSGGFCHCERCDGSSYCFKDMCICPRNHIKRDFTCIPLQEVKIGESCSNGQSCLAGSKCSPISKICACPPGFVNRHDSCVPIEDLFEKKSMLKVEEYYYAPLKNESSKILFIPPTDAMSKKNEEKLFTNEQPVLVKNKEGFVVNCKESKDCTNGGICSRNVGKCICPRGLTIKNGFCIRIISVSERPSGGSIGHMCKFESDCLASNSRCRHGRCTCSIGFRQFGGNQCIKIAMSKLVRNEELGKINKVAELMRKEREREDIHFPTLITSPSIPGGICSENKHCLNRSYCKRDKCVCPKSTKLVRNFCVDVILAKPLEKCADGEECINNSECSNGVCLCKEKHFLYKDGCHTDEQMRKIKSFLVMVEKTSEKMAKAKLARQNSAQTTTTMDPLQLITKKHIHPLEKKTTKPIQTTTKQIQTTTKPIQTTTKPIQTTTKLTQTTTINQITTLPPATYKNILPNETSTPETTTEKSRDNGDDFIKFMIAKQNAILNASNKKNKFTSSTTKDTSTANTTTKPTSNSFTTTSEPTIRNSTESAVIVTTEPPTSTTSSPSTKMEKISSSRKVNSSTSNKIGTSSPLPTTSKSTTIKLERTTTKPPTTTLSTTPDIPSKEDLDQMPIFPLIEPASEENTSLESSKDRSTPLESEELPNTSIQASIEEPPEEEEPIRMDLPPGYSFYKLFPNLILHTKRTKPTELKKTHKYIKPLTIPFSLFQIAAPGQFCDDNIVFCSAHSSCQQDLCTCNDGFFLRDASCIALSESGACLSNDDCPLASFCINGECGCGEGMKYSSFVITLALDINFIKLNCAFTPMYFQSILACPANTAKHAWEDRVAKGASAPVLPPSLKSSTLSVQGLHYCQCTDAFVQAGSVCFSKGMVGNTIVSPGQVCARTDYCNGASSCGGNGVCNCNEGLVMQDSRCVSNSISPPSLSCTQFPEVCIGGSRCVEGACMCANGIALTNGVCPDRQILVKPGERCVGEEGGGIESVLYVCTGNSVCVTYCICPGGENIIEGVCLPKESIANPGESCEINLTQCSSNSQCIDKVCTCNGGYVNINNECVVSFLTTEWPCSNCHNLPNLGESCTINTGCGYGGVCLSPGICQCLPNSSIQNGYCVPNGGGTALPGQVCSNSVMCSGGSVCALNNICVCPFGSFPVNNECVRGQTTGRPGYTEINPGSRCGQPFTICVGGSLCRGDGGGGGICECDNGYTPINNICSLIATTSIPDNYRPLFPGESCGLAFTYCVGGSFCDLNVERCICPVGQTPSGMLCVNSFQTTTNPSTLSILPGQSCDALCELLGTCERYCGGNSLCVGGICTCPMNQQNVNGRCQPFTNYGPGVDLVNSEAPWTNQLRLPGQACNTYSTCIGGSTCVGESCQCPSGFVPTNDKKSCINLEYLNRISNKPNLSANDGDQKKAFRFSKRKATCTDNDQCQGGMVCSQGGTCTCPQSLTNYNGQCLDLFKNKLAYPGSKCIPDDNIDGQKLICTNGSECEEGFCLCPVGTLTALTGFCMPIPEVDTKLPLPETVRRIVQPTPSYTQQRRAQNNGHSSYSQQSRVDHTRESVSNNHQRKAETNQEPPPSYNQQKSTPQSKQPYNNDINEAFVLQTVPDALSDCPLDGSCALPDCFCSRTGKEVPGRIPPANTPQMVILTFDGPVNDRVTNIYKSILSGKHVNPNGCPIKATFFVSHEWSNYDQIEWLYSAGHEIAINSITHRTLTQSNEVEWKQEMDGMRAALSKFSFIDKSKVIGIRAPQLAMGGNAQFGMMAANSFLYDNTQGTVGGPFWPQSLKFKTPWPCIGQSCPNTSHEVWEFPLDMIVGSDGRPNVLIRQAVTRYDSPQKVADMIMANFNRSAVNNRAPFILNIDADFLNQIPYEGGSKAIDLFIEKVLELNEVFLVTMEQALNWIQQPTPLNKLRNFRGWQCQFGGNGGGLPCENPSTCTYSGDNRIKAPHSFRVCGTCPRIYPWIDDPTGKGS